jgi:B12-binding domain/radical SAM domain protein
MNGIRVIFRWSSHNQYSVATLIGLLDDRLPAERFEILRAPSLAEVEDGACGNDTSVVAYSFTSLDADAVRDEIRALRAGRAAHAVVICGGPHTSAEPEDVLAWGADAAFVGEAEETLPAYLLELEASGSAPRDRLIRGAPVSDLDAYPPFAAGRGLFAPIELRRGCANRCTFCQTPRLFGPVRERSVEAVMRSARQLVDAGKNRIVFTSPDALLYGSRDGTVDLGAVEELLAAVSSTGLSITFGFFPSEVGPRSLARAAEAAHLLRKHVAHDEIVIGAQSASPRVLKLLGRAHTVADADEAVAIAAAAGFTPVVDVLTCTPGELPDERRQTLEWMREVRSRHGARFNLHHFTPLPGTPLAGRSPEAIERDVLDAFREMVATGAAVGHYSDEWLATSTLDVR